MRGQLRRTWAILLAAAGLTSGVAACGGTATTPAPIEYPLMACSMTGAGSVQAPRGDLVLPGTIVFAYEVWHNESEPGAACGAQSVEGAKRTIRREDVVGDVGIPFVATLQRATPLVVPEERRPTMRLFRLDAAGPALVETQELQSEPQYQASGWVLAGTPVGRYRMEILSAAGETLAEGTFEIVD